MSRSNNLVPLRGGIRGKRPGVTEVGGGKTKRAALDGGGKGVPGKRKQPVIGRLGGKGVRVSKKTLLQGENYGQKCPGPRF